MNKHKKDIICWWSGGITSAVACKKAIDIFGIDRCNLIMIDTKNEHPDTYRFKKDCEKWYGKTISTISFSDYRKFDDIKNIDDMNGREPEPLIECNGFCGLDDLKKSFNKKNSYERRNYNTPR